MAERGMIAIWHDVRPEMRSRYLEWHSREHMPERLAIPGFLRGRRFVAVEADLEFLTLYETASPDVAESAAYRARLDDPTPATREVVAHFSGTVRSPARIVAEAGAGEGGLCATWRLDTTAGEAASRPIPPQADLDNWARLPGLCAVRFLTADRRGEGTPTAEQELRKSPDGTSARIVIAEGHSDVREFRASCARIPSSGFAGSAAKLGLYRLQLSLGRLG